MTLKHVPERESRRDTTLESVIICFIKGTTCKKLETEVKGVLGLALLQEFFRRRERETREAM
jgi:hypothetical protein